MESDNQSIIIKLDNEYVIDNTLKTIIDNVMKLDLPNDKKVKMLKYVLSINFDIKITNNPAIIDMIKELVGDDIVTGVARETYKRNQKRYYQTHKEIYKEKYREKAQMIKEYKEMKAQQQKQQ